MKAAILVLGLVIAFSSVVPGQTPAGIIFDTDMGNDVDDARPRHAARLPGPP